MTFAAIIDRNAAKMTRPLALLMLSAFITLVYSMEMKETVQRMVMVRTTGSEKEPEAKGFIYKRESVGPAQLVKMEQDQVLDELSKLGDFPQAFFAPLPYAAGPFYNEEEDAQNAGSAPENEAVIPVFEQVEESNESNDDTIPAAAVSRDEFSKSFPSNDDEHYASDFNDYLDSLGYHDEFYRGGSWSDYGNSDIHDNADDRAPNHYRYYVDSHTPSNQNTEKYAIYTLPAKDKNHAKATSKVSVNDESSKSPNHRNDFRADYASAFDGFYKTSDNSEAEPYFGKTIDKYHRDFDNYEPKKGFEDSDTEASKDYFQRISARFDYSEPKGEKSEDGERANASDLQGRVAEELRDCCYEEKSKEAKDGNPKLSGETHVFSLSNRRR